MTKTSLLIFLAFFLALKSHCQELSFVKDSIMEVYMTNGYANEHFQSKGKKDKSNKKNGIWKEYEVAKSFAYVTLEGNPVHIFGNFLMYCEGRYQADKREGSWKMYVLEDKTFKKILHQEVWYENGVKSGSYTYFFPSGKVGIVGQYVDDKLNGEIISYYEDGNLYGARFYSFGLRFGKHSYFHPNGKLKFECHFINDVKDGLYQSFYANGNLQEIFSYQNGQEHGSYKYYYENGQLWIHKEYSSGLLINVECNYDSEGNARDKGTLKDGNGTVNYYTEEGKIYAVHTIENGIIIKQEDR